MLEAAARFTQAPTLPALRPLSEGETLRRGPFAITPRLVDHSAFEAYALLVEAGGRRLFYSGDFRAHGRKPGAWRRLLDDPPRPVHAHLATGGADRDAVRSRANRVPSRDSADRVGVHWDSGQ
jgi:ribonuclease J